MKRPIPYVVALAALAGLLFVLQTQVVTRTTPTAAFASVKCPDSDRTIAVHALPDLVEGEMVLQIQGVPAQVSVAPWASYIDDLLPAWIDGARCLFGREMIVSTDTGQCDPIRVCDDQTTLSASLSSDRSGLALSVYNGDKAAHQIWLIDLRTMKARSIFEQRDSSAYTGLEKTVRWAPDGQLYFVGRSEGIPSVYSFSQGADPALLIQGACYPIPAPDGSYLAYRQVDKGGRLEDWVVLDLTDDTRTTNSNHGLLAWLPGKGRYVVYFGDELTISSVSDGDLHKATLPGPIGLLLADQGSLQVSYVVTKGSQIMEIRTTRIALP